ncbi:EAL domain-containing protein [Williamsia herbipolensis]|uniref:EAL domain-containing protein n=1 Tax=Williamsia herbipolensis TaxID=1603258 RepID=A0AAU4JYY8_9NOCA|nr:EAL domain-containing protein [Williamsia herbipolensis]
MRPSTDAAEPSPMTVDIETVYQPVVEVETRAVVGFEALTRAASGVWSSAGALFHAAERQNLTVEFDWRCRVTSLRGALAGGFPSGLTLFLNAEPAALDATPPADAHPVLAAARGLSVTVEITERHLMRDPAGLLRAVEHARRLGWRIALDDVGADSSSLAMLELLRPDVIKLDMSLVQERLAPDSADTIVTAVRTEADRTGAVIVAEGIENERHEQRAIDLGAHHGQGYFYGRPGPLPTFGPSGDLAEGIDRAPLPAVTVRDPAAVTPWGVCRSVAGRHGIDGNDLAASEERLLARAAQLGPSAMVFVTIPASSDVSPDRHALLRDVASRTALTAVFHTTRVDDDTGFRAVVIGTEEPLARERSVIVVSPTFTASSVALEAGQAADGSPRYERVLTEDREIALGAATLLARRIPAHDPVG